MPTIIDVAKMSGVSKSTISRYLNGEHVKEENKQKIDTAIQLLDYRINPIARGLRTKKTYTIGVVIPNIIDMFCTYVVQRCEEYLNELGYSIILCDSMEDIDRERERLEVLKNKKVDGIIIEPCSDRKDHIKKVIDEGIPVVLIDRLIQGLDCDSVLVDNLNGAYRGVLELIKRGHKKIGIINGPEYLYTAQERFKGYRRALSDYGIEINNKYIKKGDFKKESGKKYFVELLNMEDKPTAVFITNYFMGIGAIEAIHMHNVKIPEDISIITFDSINVSYMVDLTCIVNPKISTIKQPMREIGRTAAELIYKRIANDEPDYKTRVVRLNTEIEITDSVMNMY